MKHKIGGIAFYQCFVLMAPHHPCVSACGID